VSKSKNKGKPVGKAPMSMKEFEGSKADKIADAKALKKINEKRKGK
jgi:hypothetical protein